jgi:pimeloyl-ACP methyl ester carboxylesterase
VDDGSSSHALDYFVGMQPLVKEAAQHAETIASTPEGRRRVTAYITTNFEHIPPDLIAHLTRGAAGCDAVFPLVEYARREGWRLDAENITCPVRVVWGTQDKLLPWPAAAARYRDDWLPTADWVELDGAGHCLQLDVPLETAQLILGFTR